MLHEVSFTSYNERDQVQAWIYVPACIAEWNRSINSWIWRTLKTLYPYDFGFSRCWLYCSR